MYLFKQITREIVRNKIFVFLLFLLSAFTSFMYFFVQFSIDGNMKMLKSLSVLSENQLLYQKALNSNVILSKNFLIVLIGLTSFVFAMFFYRFYKSNGKQIGCLRALGYKNRVLRSYFVSFTAILFLVGGLFGFVFGYFASDILINANKQSYNLAGLIKNIDLSSIIIGLLAPIVIFCIVTFFSYGFVGRMEVGNLLSGVNNKYGFSGILKFVNSFVKILPVKDKFPYRIAFRKPIAVLLIITAVMGFMVMFIMGYSLNRSSQKVFLSQTVGHRYMFDTHFTEFKIKDEEKDNSIYYLISDVVVKSQNGTEVEQQIIGIEQNDKILALQDRKGKLLNGIKKDKVYISPALNELYGFNIGDKIILTFSEKNYPVIIENIAINAKSKSIYISKEKLAEILNLPANVYNGILSMKEVLSDEGITTTYERKIANLERDSVSNRNSAVINQIIGFIVGSILLYLALLINFQENKRDILILHLMGYKPKAIGTLLIDIYRPIIGMTFLLTLMPSSMIAQSVQKTLSIQTGDYMPFQISYLFIFVIFILLNMLYSLVKITFSREIKSIIKRENITHYTNTN